MPPKELSADVLYLIFDILSARPDYAQLSIWAKSDTWQDARCPQATMLLDVTLVNHAWHAVAQQIIDRRLELTLSVRNEARNIRVLQRLRQQPGYQSRLQDLVIRDVHTQQRVPLGVEDFHRNPVYDPVEGQPFHGPRRRTPRLQSERVYCSKEYTLTDIPEPSINTQLAAVASTLLAASPRTFTWAAIPPMSLNIVDALAERQVHVHILLNVHAIETASWSWSPVVNHAILSRLAPLAARIKTLELCLPQKGPSKPSPVLFEVVHFLSTCSELSSLRLHTLGRPWFHHTVPVSRDIKGPYGPLETLAHDAVTKDYTDWSTGFGSHSPYHHHPLFLEPQLSPLLPRSLTRLTLVNFCVCAEHPSMERALTIPQLPGLQMLHISCLRFLKETVTSMHKLRILHLSLSDSWSAREEPCRFAVCAPGWSRPEMTELLLKLPPLQELEIRGTPDLLSQLALLHHGKTLRKLVLLHRDSFDRHVAYRDWSRPLEPPGLMTNLPSVIMLLTDVCPCLEELACDAPNASTEFDHFLAVIVNGLPRLRSLHLRRSFEPYGDTIPATKFSYARFTKAAMASIWSILSQKPSFLQLKITIGRLASWDEVGSTMIAPAAESRTFVMQRKCATPSIDSSQEHPEMHHLEHVEVMDALAQQRPGPLMDYWQAQADVVSRSIEEHNSLLYPRQYLVDGVETNYTNGIPPNHRLIQNWDKKREQIKEAFSDALQAQHEAERAELDRSTRVWY